MKTVFERPFIKGPTQVPYARGWEVLVCGFLVVGLISIAGWRESVASDVLTQRYNLERTGSVSQSGLNQTTVRDPRWGLIRTLSVQGIVYAQPLYVENLVVPGTNERHDVVFIATGQNNVYAFDTNTFAPFWKSFPLGLHLGDNDRTTIGSPGCDSISSPQGIGIESTPVIDRERGLMFISYRVNRSTDRNSAEQRLRSIDIRTGAQVNDVRVDPPNAPLDWAVWHRSRAGLLLLNGVVYVAFASRCEDPGQPIFHGWIIGHDAVTLRSVAAFQTTPDPSQGKTIDGGGIWQGAVGLAADEQGAIYATTGNRRPAGSPDNSPRDTPNLADSFIKLNPAITRKSDGTIDRVNLTVADFFTPYRKIWLDENDLDLAAAGPVVIPGTHYLIGGGKSGIVYVLDRNNMGKTDGHLWKSGNLDQVPLDAIQTEWPEDYAADRVTQKFQAAFNQYVPEGSPYLSRSGSPVVAAMQNAGQQDLFAVGRDGALWVYWEEVASGAWTDGTSGRRGPAAITQARLAPTRAAIVAAKQTDNQLDAFVVGNDGAIYVTWETADGHWADATPGQPAPARITPANFAPPGAHLATGNQTSNQLDVFAVGSDGSVQVTWVAGIGHWSDGTPGNPAPARITPVAIAPPGANVAAANQNGDQLDAFVVAKDGSIQVTWVAGAGHWSDGTSGNPGPARITPQGIATPGGAIAAATQGDNQLDVFVAGNDGALYVTWVVGGGHWSDGTPGNAAPARITPTGFAPKGACVTAVHQNDQQLDAFAVGNDGAVYVTWVVGGGHWSDGTPGNPAPAAITPKGFAIPGSCVAAMKPTPQQLNVFVVGIDGTPSVTFELNDGRWTDGNAGGPGPTGLAQAIWMRRCWPCWPHIHGSPVFAAFQDGRAMLYVWPEKDHLKAFPWSGSRVDVDRLIIGVGQNSAPVLAPPGPPFGMPGGMLAVSVDPGQAAGGVVFASIARPEGDQMQGQLRAFDPISLQELWNNGNANYRFVKFVPPTIAGGRVLLPTGSNEVLVYGLR